MENIMKDFLLHFSALFIAVTFGMAFFWLLMGSASDARPPFRHWHSFIPFPVFGIFFAAGAALARTLPRVTTIPDSFWETAITVVVFVLPGAWLASRLSANHIRPFLKKCIEESNNTGQPLSH